MCASRKKRAQRPKPALQIVEGKNLTLTSIINRGRRCVSGSLTARNGFVGLVGGRQCDFDALGRRNGIFWGSSRYL
jgi:hypothetical protein